MTSKEQRLKPGTHTPGRGELPTRIRCEPATSGTGCGELSVKKKVERKGEEVSKNE